MAIPEFVTKLQTALEKLVTLEIVTAVGAVSANSDKLDPQAKTMRTRINLAEGDITTEIDPAFLTGDYTTLREFHAARENQATEIIKANVDMLERLFNLVVKVTAQTRDNPPTPPST
jgi:hypothetical protein